MNIGSRIKSRREELGFSQEDLAKLLGYKSRSSINKIEMGINDITQHKIVSFAKALQTTPAYLMGWDDDSSSMKKNDAIADIILRLRSDEHFMQVVESLASLSEDQLSAVQTFLSAFKK
jgi:transcriptional regulator with XRE-family HTH domain